ncbi:MAG: PEGA domain-containing protein [Deltaproteobacteria bacterium]|nr:PEGA domain-containing protein [Deltaproteobacteria bacterium]
MLVCRDSAGFGALVLLVLLVTAPAHAQERTPCADVPADASAADQALCWDTRIQRGAEECTGDRSTVCTERLAAYCEDAALDDANVSAACFRAFVRLGRHEPAAATVRYLRELTEAAGRCRAAYTEPVSFRVVTNPAGAEVVVEGESYGTAPVEIRLSQPWWTRHVTVLFATRGARTRVVELARERLEAAFDRSSCGTRDVVVQGPAGTITEPPPGPDADDRRSPPVVERARVSVPGLVTTVAGGAIAIAGSVLLVLAETWAQELHDLEPGSTWDADRQAQLDRIEPTRIVGGTVLGIGVIAIGAGLTLLLLDDGGSGGTERASRIGRLRMSASAAGWEWRF